MSNRFLPPAVKQKIAILLKDKQKTLGNPITKNPSKGTNPVTLMPTDDGFGAPGIKGSFKFPSLMKKLKGF